MENFQKPRQFQIFLTPAFVGSMKQVRFDDGTQANILRADGL
ncbi:MAG TPA: hypothetical protein PLA27_05380 [Anaerolineales bacterium]|nr:hypothetical protein [Anaerolineales bacterium]